MKPYGKPGKVIEKPGNRISRSSARRKLKKPCVWFRKFDGNFCISCVEKTHKRANGDFKGKGAKWEFKYCPYCGREIVVKESPAVKS